MDKFNPLWEQAMKFDKEYEGCIYRMPNPFQDKKDHVVKVLGESIYVAASFVKAILAKATWELKAEGQNVDETVYFSPFNLMIGTRSIASTKAEEVYVEYREKECSDHIQCCQFDPVTGQVHGGLFKRSTGRMNMWKSGAGEKDFTAIWVAIMEALDMMAPGENWIQSYSALKISLVKSPTEVGFIYDHILSLAEIAYDHLVLKGDIPIGIASNENVISQIGYQNIKMGKIGPQLGKVRMGTCEVFKSAGAHTTECINIDTSKYSKLRWVRPFASLSQAEKILVPKIDPKHRVTIDERDTLDEIFETKELSPDQQVTNVLFVGPTGCGKTESVSFIAGTLQRPLLRWVASSNTDESSILGYFLPDVGEETVVGLNKEEQEIYKVIMSADDSGDPESLMEGIAKILDLPTPLEIYFDPDSSFERMTGNYQSGVDDKEVRAVFDAKINNKIKRIISAAKEQTSNQDNVRYKYIPSNIVRAIKHGYALEIQEPTNIRDQAVLSVLYDVLEKSSAGILNLQHEDIVRHPDFLCFMTTNVGYVGNRLMSPALLSRFQVFNIVDELTETTLIERVMSKAGIDDFVLAKDIVTVYQRAVSSATDESADGEASPRGLFGFANAIKRGKDPMWAFTKYLLGPIAYNNPEVRASVRAAVEECNLFHYAV